LRAVGRRCFALRPALGSLAPTFAPNLLVPFRPFASRFIALGFALRLGPACRPLILVALALAGLFLRLYVRLRVGDATVSIRMFAARTAERTNAPRLVSEVGDETVGDLHVAARSAFLPEVALDRARGCLTERSVLFALEAAEPAQLALRRQNQCGRICRWSLLPRDRLARALRAGQRRRRGLVQLGELRPRKSRIQAFLSLWLKRKDSQACLVPIRSASS